MLKNPTTLAPATQDDEEFLYSVYANTRQEELAQVPWDSAQKDAFLRFQFHAQRTYYQEHFPDASYDVILLDGKPIGRLYIDRRPDEIRLIDIALLDTARGRGLGGAIMADILAEGQASQLLVRIHVEAENPAMRLYKRLGFEKIEEQGVYHLMEWQPTVAAASGETDHG